MISKPKPIIIDYRANREETNNATYKNVEDLAFAYWQYTANEKAYANKMITRNMYEYARDEVRKLIDRLETLCCQ